ncbi:Ribosomal protein L31e [Carpediemonas membranifera]|uniref:Ribosomal protein L31e n=1 Tax=Carpediemonas membranifera TaxID=201153 RepID=A0A8J6AQN8_9EUKA|nr:Ribosomal protein L31e [Carpediemonas membranifera]|eukprot:TRINITY_DN9193_c0_g1_i1.p3 TRINITY_DN9193_c0_g1~~TRINITY_DN9193_c0_g1_i1.p3  ORF type:complete len:104 (+),score=17.38 TRINITY_DN9193_c0_g1_i1:13-324(+)
MAKVIKIREDTLNLKKRLHRVTFSKRAPKAIKELRAYAHTFSREAEVRIDAALNHYVWSKGIRHLPNSVRVRMVLEEEDDKHIITLSHVAVTSFKGLLTEKCE